MPATSTNSSKVVCRCETDREPLCGFCEDDLFCPQCGDMITRVVARDAHPSSKVIWIYADDDTGEFRFSLKLEARGRERQPAPGRPHLDRTNSRLHVAKHFEPVVEEVGPPADGVGTEYRLKPRAEEAASSNWVRLLPPEGLPGRLDAVGAFDEQHFDFQICQAPRFDVRLRGPDIDDVENLDQSSWRIWKPAQLRITVDLEARTAPVFLESDLRLEAESLADQRLFELENAPTAGAMLVPGKPLSMTLRVDASDWVEGDARTFTLRMDYGTRTFVKPLQLQMVALGNVQFHPAFLVLDDLRLGDRLDSQDPQSKLAGLLAFNDGAEPLYLNDPEIEIEAGPPAAEWISARWLGETTEPSWVLEPGDSLPINLKIDLSRIAEQKLPPDQQLKAAIVVRHDNRPWRLKVVIPNLVRRPLHEGWLAIDFGSTNTYAAVSLPQPGSPKPRIVPLLNPANPERFDSVIFFQDVAEPAAPQCVFGPEAAKRGEGWPTAMVSGMKRALGLPGPLRMFPILDPNKRDASYDVETLVKLLLKDVIRRCEDALRSRIEKIGLSFPANYGPERIAALERVAQRLKEELAAESPPRQLVYDKPRLDEATAVVLAFALDALSPPIEQLVREKRSLVVASLDFGGGTLDTAVIRMRFEGNLMFPRYGSTYLGIGGDANLGGENVTLSLQELLLERLRSIVQEALGDEPLPELKLARRGERGSHAERTNFEALWAAAERMKIALCAATPTEMPTADEMPAWSDSLATHLLTQLNRLRALFRAEGKLVERPLVENEAIRNALEQAVSTGSLLVSLDEIYDHEIKCDLRAEPGRPIRQRLTRCVEELSSFADRHGEQIDVVVLAGAAARLPLVEALIRERLPNVTIEFDRHSPKSKVSSGLVRYLSLRQDHQHLVAGIACPIDFLQEPLGVVHPANHVFIPVIPAWSPINDPARWFPFEGIPLDGVWSSERRLQLWTDGHDGRQVFGTFNLKADATPPPDQPELLKALPAPLPQEHRAEIRFADGRKRIELRAIVGQQQYGYWELALPTVRPLPTTRP